MQLTIAICTYNRFDLLKKCLDSIINQHFPEEELKILVIDNSRNELKSKNFYENYKSIRNLEYVITEKSGLSYARNIALEKCNTKYIAYIDDDAVADRHWAENIINAFKKYESAGVVGGKVEPIWETEKPIWLKGTILDQLALLDWGEDYCFVDNRSGKWLIGANTAYLVSALKIIGGFSTTLGRCGALLLCHEELAVNEAIHKIGYDVVYSPNIKVEHLIQSERMTIGWLCEDAYWEGASRVIFDNSINNINITVFSEILTKKMLSMIHKLSNTYEFKDIARDIERFRDEGRYQCSKYFGIEKNGLHKSYNDEVWPVIYVVTPCLNANKTIDKTILSVATQSGNFAIRYHIQDGGSTDGTINKLEEWKYRLKRSEFLVKCKNVVFSFSSKKDDSIYEAINSGFGTMAIPKNAFMTWINADDTLMQNSFSSILGISSQLNNVHWIGGTINAVFDNGEIVYHSSVALPTEFIRNGVCDGLNWHTVQQEGTFWRKWIWENVGGLNQKLKLAGDWDLWRRFSEYTEYFQVPWSLGSFYQRKGQISTSNNGKSYQAEIDSIIPHSDRYDAIKKLSKKRPDDILTPVISLDFISKKYRIYYRNIRGRVPWQAIKFFKTEDTVQNDEENKLFLNPTFNPVIPRINFIDKPLFRKIFELAPRFVQKKLSFFKHRVIIPLMKIPGEFYYYMTIRRSKLFYFSYYCENYPDVVSSKSNPLIHYIRHGGKEGRAPNPLFDSTWYLRSYPDVAEKEINPLFHYIKFGHFEGRDPGPNFSTKNYLKAYPDVKEAGINPLLHYLKYGAIEGRKIC